MDDELKTLRASYKKKLPEKIKNINLQWNRVLKTGDNEDMEALYKLIHMITGSSGSYGYPEISEATKDLEMFLKEVIHNKNPLNSNQIKEIEIKLENIKAVINKIILSNHD